MATTIRKRQIADGAIDNSKIQAGAGIESSKLADGGEFIKRDGSVPMTGALAMGNQKITGLQTATNNDEAVNLGQMNAAIAAVQQMFKSKQSVRAATTGNINISNPATSGFDGVTLTAGQRLLVLNQSTPAQNGIYVFNGSSSALTRAADADTWDEIVAALVTVEEGTTQADKIYLCTANQGGTLGTTSIAFQGVGVSTGGLLDSNFVVNEVPSGLINGVNTTFTLASTPTAGTEMVFLNGLLQESGSGNDYTISGNTITMLAAPLSGEKIRVSYRKA